MEAVRRACLPGGAVLALVLCAWAGAGEEAVAVSVQGVQASKGAPPQMDASLAPHAQLLRALGFDQYKDLGSASGQAQPGSGMALRVAAYGVDVLIVRKAADCTTVKVTVKQNNKEICQMMLKLHAGEVSPIQVGQPASPVILLVRAGG